MSILVVDDNIVLLQNVARSFSRIGYSVETAMNLAQAREILRTFRIDVICLDLQLADGHGLDLLEELRVDNPTLPTVIMSASHTPENRDRSARLGAAAFLPKPFALSKLQSLVENLSATAGLNALSKCSERNAPTMPTLTMEI